MTNYQNYHKHTDYSNVFTPDSATTIKDYAERTVELGQGILTSMEHGFQGRYYEVYEVAKKHNLKFIFGTEAYWVKDRKEKDRTNSHICIFAKTEKGRREINRILSDANIDGYYYKPRIDLDLILSLTPSEVFVTSACFEKDTKVLTKNGTKNIQDVNSLDMVLTHKGTWEKVIAPTSRHYNDNMYDLTVEGCFEKIKCTNDHKFPTIRKTHSDVTKNIVWKKAQDLDCNDRILSAIDESFESIESIDVDFILKDYRKNCNMGRPLKSPILSSEIQIDSLFLQVLGLYVAEGNTNNKKNYLCFTLHKDEIDLFNIIDDFSMKYLNKHAVIHDKKGTNGMSVLIHSKELTIIFTELIPSGVKNKKTPNFILNLNPELQMEYIKGLFLGDGHVSKSSYRISHVTISEQLGYEVLYILERNGIKCSCYIQDEKVDKNQVHHNKTYRVEINSKTFHSYWKSYLQSNYGYNYTPSGWNSKKPVNINGVKYMHKKIKQIQTYKYSGDVYCLNVENTHSFRVEGISAHNCVTYWHYEDIDEITERFYNHFGNNFMLEVQYHHTDSQKTLNKKILELKEKHGMNIILGCDSHYILPEDSKGRDDVLQAKGIRYEEEEGWFLDFPSAEIAYQRLIDQGILSESQILEAMENTNVFLEFDDIEFSKDIKLPTLYPNKTQDEKDKIYLDLLIKSWDEYSKEIPEEEYPKYREEIKKEAKVVINTKMSDYFLIDHEIVKKAISMGGVITPTGRGSAVSFFTNTLLGFSKVDRLASPVHLYPERFMSESRILQQKSLPDIDFNCGNTEIFVQAQDDVLGKEHAYPMITWGKFQASSAFKLYARSQKIDFDIANHITKQIEKYEIDLKYASDDEKDVLDIYDYIDEEYHAIYDGSHKYRGIISNRSVHACGYLLYQGNIKEELGLMLVKSATSEKETLVTVIDGHIAEDYKFLKNDWLIVDTVMTTDLIYKKIGIKKHNINQLSQIIKNDKKTWDIYAKGLTIGVNQVEKASTMNKAKRYKPQNVSELTAFIAGIRPSFKSMYSVFESRQPFSYGIPSFDNLIQTEEMPKSFVLYQEQIMATLGYAGFKTDETYGIIKAISKKKPDVVNPLKKRFIEGFCKKTIEDNEISKDDAFEMSEKVWKIIEDSASYSFNCSHALSYAYDSLFCAYLKANYPLEFYETMLKFYSEKGNKNKVSKFKQEMKEGFNIDLGKLIFGRDNTTFVLDKESNVINESMLSVKFLSQKVSQELYQLSSVTYFDFLDLLTDIKTKTSTDSRQLDILTKLNYFENFGGNKKILKFIEYFNMIYSSVQVKKDKYDSELMAIIARHSGKETEKLYKELNNRAILTELWYSIEDETIKLTEQAKAEFEYLGYVMVKEEHVSPQFFIVTEMTFGKNILKPFLTLYNISNGKTMLAKVTDEKLFAENKIKEFELIKIEKIKEQPKKRKVNGKWKDLKEKNIIITDYSNKFAGI